MFVPEKIEGSKAEIYAELARQARGLFEGERDAIANAANLVALLWQGLPDMNWAGTYFLRGGALVLGPFQGLPACVRIAMGKGVCGTAAARRESVIVKNVHEFPGHIVCDAASNSELVVPLMRSGPAIGVIDLDSPKLARFDEEDRKGVEALARLWVAASDPL